MAVLDEFDKRNYCDENGESLRVHYPEETFGKMQWHWKKSCRRIYRRGGGKVTKVVVQGTGS